MPAGLAHKVTDWTTVRDGGSISIDKFIDLGIDDLAKYRVVQLLCDYPETRWDAATYAERLGLYSIDRTRTLLEELVESRILEAEGADDQRSYGLTSHTRVRHRLAQLLSLASSRILLRDVVAYLAARSLRRAGARTRHRSLRLAAVRLDA